MKKTVSLLALLMIVFPALVFAYPGIGGGKGLLRVQNALVEDEAGLTISLHGLGRRPFFPGTNTKGWVLDLVAPELSYAPVVTKYAGLEVFGSWGWAFQNPKSATVSKSASAGLATLQLQDLLSGLNLAGYTMSMRDLKAGGKLSIPVLPVLKLGFAGSYTFLTSRKDGNDVTWLDPYALPQAGDTNLPSHSKFAWTGLATLQLQDLLLSAPNLMFNYGKINEETRYGVGVELAGRGFALFGEVLSRQPPGSTSMFDADTGHIYLTPGVVFGNVSAVSVKAAYSFALGHKADNGLILGLSFATPFGARAKPQYGTITGTVTDEKTGAALTANVEFPKDNQMSPLSTDATGVFEVKKVRTGVKVVEVGAQGYRSQSVPLDVKKDAVTTHDFKLRSLVAYGVVAGTVLDATSKKPLEARIEFPKSSIAAVNSDPTGAFRVDNVPTGVYSVTAALEGYFTGSQTVTVEDGKVANVEFQLRPAAEFGSVSGAVTDATTGKPVTAQVSFSDPAFPAVTADPATGFYKVDRFPVGVIVVKATADGYFPGQMTVTIEANKAATQNFALSPSSQNGQLTGVVTDLKTKATLQATIYFPNSATPSVMSDSATGLYKADVPVGATIVACSLPGYVKQMSTSPVIVKKDAPAIYNFQMLKLGTEITLQSDAIHFAFNSSEIQSAGYPALDGWVKMMKDNPFMTAEIQGHTDAVGSESYNQALSERRAASVVSYLVGRGIERDRLTSIGYGESRLVEQTQERSETNRRVVLKVTGEKPQK